MSRRSQYVGSNKGRGYNILGTTTGDILKELRIAKKKTVHELKKELTALGVEVRI